MRVCIRMLSLSLSHLSHTHTHTHTLAAAQKLSLVSSHRHDDDVNTHTHRVIVVVMMIICVSTHEKNTHPDVFSLKGSRSKSEKKDMERISANDVLVKELEAMGFEKKEAEEALIKTGNVSVSKAVSWITSRPIDDDGDGFIDDGDVVYDEETKEDDVDIKNVTETDDKKKDDKNQTHKDDEKKDGGLTVKIRKFDSGTTWEEKIRDEQNEESEWPVVETKYVFSQKRSIAKGSFGRVYIATCPSKSSRLLAIKVINIEPYVDSLSRSTFTL